MTNEREAPDPRPGRELFQVVYDELRRLAASELSHERPDHSLNPTALVHEAYLSLVGKSDANRWENRRAFFSAAAEAMRHILVDHARYHRRQKRGGGQVRLSLDMNEMPASDHSDVLAISEALDVLAKERPEAAELVKLRYFVGMTLDEAAGLLEMKASTADRRWAFAKAWLYERLHTHTDDH